MEIDYTLCQKPLPNTIMAENEALCRGCSFETKQLAFASNSDK